MLLVAITRQFEAKISADDDDNKGINCTAPCQLMSCQYTGYRYQITIGC